MSIESDVLERVSPSPEDELAIQQAVEALKQKVRETKSFSEEKIELCLVGSIAAGTHLKDLDIDLFLLFQDDVPLKRLETIGLAIGKEAIGGEEHFAEHPYIKGKFNGGENKKYLFLQCASFCVVLRLRLDSHPLFG